MGSSHRRRQLRVAVLLLLVITLATLRSGFASAHSVDHLVEADAAEYEQVHHSHQDKENGVESQPMNDELRSGQQREQCSANGQCAQEPAGELPPMLAVDSADSDTGGSAAITTAHQEQALLEYAREMVAKHVQEFDDQINVWLPHLQEIALQVVEQVKSGWQALQATYRSIHSECVVLYDLYLADAVHAFAEVYQQIAHVTRDALTVVSGWVAVIVGEARVLWQTHEEVRMVTRHVVALLVLAVFGAVFLSVYALVSTIPDSFFSLLLSLDDTTRAQLKAITVLFVAFAFYQLSATWSFWAIAAVLAIFYYWSGHVVATPVAAAASVPSLQRQGSSLQRQGSLQRQASRGAADPTAPPQHKAKAKP